MRFFLSLLLTGLMVLPGFPGAPRPARGAETAREKALYHCPMHPDYTSDRPGDCPICGMALVKTQAGPVGGQPAGADSSGEKTAGEICVEQHCTMPGCRMTVKTHILPGERISCPVCGDYIATADGRLVQVVSASPPVGGVARKILFYRNPMNPAVTSPVPMKDAMGMDFLPVYEQESVPVRGPTVVISPERQQRIGVTTETVGVRALVKTVRASGRIAYDPELALAQGEFVQALGAQDRLKLSPARDEADRAAALTQASRNKLRLLGMGEDQIRELEKTRAPQTNLYLPGGGEGVWAYVSVYEREIGLVKPGAAVSIEAVAYPGETFAGTVVSASPVLDPATRTNQVRVSVPGAGGRLKPEMFVTATLRADLGRKLAVPETAVLDTGLRKIVYLLRGNDVLESREVRLGRKAGRDYEVLDGLQEGDRVVTSGNFLVDSEAKLQNPSRGQ